MKLSIWLAILLGLVVVLGISVNYLQAAPASIGNGTPASCTEQAFDAALASRAPITFNCGAKPFTLVVTSTKIISSNLIIDGGRKITLSGANRIRVLWIDSNATVTLKNIAIIEGKAEAYGVQHIVVAPSRPPPITRPTLMASPTMTVTRRPRTVTPTRTNSRITPRPGRTATRSLTATRTRRPQTATPTRTITRTPTPTQVVTLRPTPRGRLPLPDNPGSFGAGIFNDGGTVTLDTISLSHNVARIRGGGLFNYGGKVTIIGSSITHNTSTLEGSGIANFGGIVTIDNTTLSDMSKGAAIYNGEKGILTITNTTIGNNNRGSIFNKDAALTLKNVLLSENRGNQRGDIMSIGGTVALSAITVSDYDAAGMFVSKEASATIENSHFTDNAYMAISVDQGASVVITGSTFQGGLGTNVNGVANSNGNVTIINSTFTGGKGDAIAHQGTGTLAVFNSTISGYGTSDTDHTLNILNGKALIVNTTIAYNKGNGIGRAVGVTQAPDITIRNSIIAYNRVNCAMPLIDGGNNLQFPMTTCGTSIKTADPLLDPQLTDNGGSTQTITLLPQSPAIDAGNPSICLSAPINNLDQRGYLRDADGDEDGRAVCDIGAFEFNAKPSRTAVLAPTRIVLPPPCPDLNGITNEVVRATIPDGAVSAGTIFCRVIITNVEIGVQSVIERGVVQAAEISALTTDGTELMPTFNKEVKVCLRGNGIALLLDARTTPRRVIQLKSTSENSFTCAMLKSSGTFVLVLR